jgi:hypothetical protein
MERTNERLARAEDFLQEAVFRSRSAQAGAGLWAAGDPAAADCGLGARAEVVLDLTPRAEAPLREFWSAPPDSPELARIRERMAEWVERQDALDRKRNHFLKAFRAEHGFDHGAYDERQRAAYRAGLDAINAQVDDARRAAARALLEPVPRGPGARPDADVGPKKSGGP